MQASTMSHVLHPRRMHAIAVRETLEAQTRSYFLKNGFRETRTPLIVPCPGMEPHIRPFQIQSMTSPKTALFLPTSPEFAMKRLLVGGLKKIFQICPAFRDEPSSLTHLPEFTLLEWYRAHSNYEAIMQDTESLFEFLALHFFQQANIPYQGQSISVKTPWPRLQIRTLFLEKLTIDLATATPLLLSEKCKSLGIPASPQESWDDLYFKLWLNNIEPSLPKDQAVFVLRYPASQAALAVLDTDPDGSRWAKRFEVYAGGLELGNAFEELTDPIEQRHRFIHDMELRTQTYGHAFPKTPLDETFLAALAEGMPPSGGIALGIDRMIMLYADESDISFTTWLPVDTVR